MQVPISEHVKSLFEVFGIRLNAEPEYEVLQRDGALEIRRYPVLVTAHTDLGKDNDASNEAGFKRLAEYIFGGNNEQRSLPMTAPVLEEYTGEHWRMAFVMPQEISERTAPTPTDTAVKLLTQPSQLVATLRYSGKADEDTIREKSTELLAWINTHSAYRAISVARSAQYDPPFTIPFLRRNEIHITVDSLH